MKQNFTRIISSLVMTVLLLAGTISAYGQRSDFDGSEKKNLVKWNVAALLLKNFSFQYERSVTEKISVAVGLRLAPKSSFPFNSRLKDWIDDEETWESIKDFKTGNFAITPEVRFYLGKGVFQGFYVAPFVRYANYSAEVPFSFDVEDGSAQGYKTESISLDGSVNTFTGGVLFGAQWKVAERFAIDWWILGPNYGTSGGDISGKRPLNQFEQNALRETLNDLDDLPVVKTKSTVDDNGAKINFDGPWAGLRAGLSIGYRF